MVVVKEGAFVVCVGGWGGDVNGGEEGALGEFDFRGMC